ncbi:MAG TPA: LamG-like jellyroll fold domain-containing protein, partial [Solirubrobacteraceae bacterium]|nr:LamG-like jellyroll fold domain-containing protein [Solirubrobacteraceae bacterium]
DGRLFDAGPERMTRTLNLSTGQWANVGMSPIDGMSAVMYRPGKILKSGTWSDPEFPGRAASNRAARIDMTAGSPAWQEAAPMKYRRSYNTLTVLPDGKVLSTGGQNGTDGVDETTGVLPAEMWDPDTDTWKTMASSRRPRLYHSSAILLPDARVLLAGGGAFGNARNEKSGEIYSPPYLFKGPRPTVSGAPDAIHYGQAFDVDTPDASRIEKVSLVRMGSVTHNIDMDQRFMELDATVQGDGLRIGGPSNANVAPPGYYMVFLVDDAGVPSTGQIVKLDPAVDTQAPTVPTNLAATARTDGALLNWNAASDNTAVDEYRVYRSTTSGFTAGAANRVARVPSGTTWTDTGVAAGTHYYRVRAVDAAGNLGPVTAQVQNVVAGDTTAPAVALTAPGGGSLNGSVQVTATATDAIGVASVQFKLDGQDLGAADTSPPFAVSWDTAATPDGAHAITAVATDASGNAQTSGSVPIEVHNTGLVASFGFDEPSGATATDTLSDHDGTIAGAARVAGGRYGAALSFDGVDDWVSVPHAAALNLSAGMTLEAWVRPTALGSWRSVVMKEQASALPYALHASTGEGVPAASVFTSSALTATGPPPLGLATWTHLAMTWDGSVLRLYVDGAEVATQPAPGALLTSTGQLRIGGNSLRGEFFSGLIDEVRVYDRALSATRIGADMNAPVNP